MITLKKYQLGILFACLTAILFFSTHDAAATTTVISSDTTVATLTINSGDTLQVNSGATLTVTTSLDNFGKINVQAGGSIGKRLTCAIITNHVGATINNHGTIDTSWCDYRYPPDLNNYGKINNGGIIFPSDINNTGTINNNGGLGFGRQFDNYGKINNVLGASIGEDSGAQFTNHVGATINNSGQIVNGESALENYGKINNSGFIEFADDFFINHVGAVINNSVGGVIRDYVEHPADNSGTINNRGTINLILESDFENTGLINNRGTINVDSDSTFDNTGGTLKDICGGVFNNAGTFLGNAIIVSC
ncbi:MAG: hypothetical protein AUH84_02505 [Thaumarchaeota archaeon 13_1_40CM_4_38_7]|nr:MAG: hypothetical protein AUH84_02505 [Thaumarchaeota archaeon 13_1_40CM_4_38_7]OLC93969.1 MAG: hypothetical protein AUI92_01715 [Thaumarchaeota archaeon 13_1_40CM_3_38_6]